MPAKRLNISTSMKMYEELEDYAEELGMDITNAIRYCLAVELERRRIRLQRERDEKVGGGQQQHDT